MQFRYWILLAVILPVAALGCGGGDEKKSPAEEPKDQAANDTPGAPGSDAADASLSGPAEAVSAFLDAVRSGNDKQAESMLTVAAREQIAEKNLAVSPPGSDTARFEIGEVQMLPEDRASVACTCIDQDEKGQARTDEVTWILRRESDGWRVGGMVATVLPDKPPTFLNFEDLEDMFRQQQMLAEELQRRAAAANSQAQRPQAPESPGGAIQR